MSSSSIYRVLDQFDLDNAATSTMFRPHRQLCWPRSGRCPIRGNGKDCAMNWTAS